MDSAKTSVRRLAPSTKDLNGSILLLYGNAPIRSSGFSGNIIAWLEQKCLAK